MKKITTDELIKNITQELLEKLLISSEVKVAEKDGAEEVTIETAEPGMLIGYHGKSLEAIQILLGQLVYKKTGVWTRIVVTVGDYRARREQQLKELALSIAEKVVDSGQPMSLRDLTPAERRIVHMSLSEHPLVMSESEGEGRDRKLVIKLRA